MLDWLEHIDTKFFLLLNSSHSPFFDNLMPWLSGNILWMPFYGWLIYSLYREISRKHFILAIVALGACVAITDLVSFHLLKETIQRYRPCHNLEIQSLIHVVDKCGGLHGFVSSHAANVFGIAMLLALLLKDWSIVIQLFIWATIVGYSRIYLGVHYPADVIGGAAFGTLIGFLCYRVFVKFAAYE